MENDDLTAVDQTEENTQVTPVIEETPASGVDATTVDTSKDGEPKSPLEALTLGIEEGQKPRRIASKGEEQSQTDTRPRNADGTFKVETAEGKTAREEAEALLAAETPEQKAARLAAETPEQKAAREAAEAAAKKAPDHVNDPIPANLNKRTAERMQYLLDTVKAQSTLAEQHTQLFDEITSTGASPQEFGAMVGYMRYVHSSEPKDWDTAYTILQSELKGLAVKMGKPLYEVNLLRDDANKDLVEEIRGGTLTANRAHEIALQRESVKYRTTTAAAKSAATTSATTEAAAQTASTKAFDELDKVLRARDGAEFQRKFDILVPMLKKTLGRLPPAERIGVFQDAYDNLVLPPVQAAVVPPKTMPQRPKQPAGAGGGGNPAAAPKSALEAMNAALEQ